MSTEENTLEKLPLEKYIPDEDGNDRLFGALTYIAIMLWFLGPIVPAYLLVSDHKKKPALKFHAVQSMITLLGSWIIASTLGFILYLIFRSSIIGCLMEPLIGLIPGIFIICHLYWGYLVYTGETFEIPYISEFVYNHLNK